MQQFIKNHAEHIMGTLSGLDRLRLRGTIRWLATTEGMAKFLGTLGILLKEFRSYAQDITHDIRSSAQQLAEEASRPYCYLASSRESKEELAREWARRDGIGEGLIAVFRCVEPCWSYQVVRNREKKQLELRGGPAKCLHLYFYFLDRVLGLMHLRLQTWFPFTRQSKGSGLFVAFGGEWSDLGAAAGAEGRGELQAVDATVEPAAGAKRAAALGALADGGEFAFVERFVDAFDPARESRNGPGGEQVRFGGGEPFGE
jgi:hypothetical protein